MSGWWIADLLNDPNRGPAKLISWIVLVIGSIVLHELAHGWAALRLGDTTPRDTGHMTWNPLVHMGPWSLAAFAVIGIAWGMMPVDPTRLRGRRAEAWVALAGPAMNIAIAAVAFVLLILWQVLAGRAGVREPLMTNLVIFFRLGVWLNIVLAVFNLLPVLPLDGGRIAANLSRGYRDLAYSERGQWIMLGGFILFFWFGFDLVAAWSIDLLAAAEHAVIGLF
ncbi:MAG TPA: site-2 protease family protein [Phycisphaerales bacterium]|nr:site-2 protease family protein [Phycisphaerales bacterium]